MIEQAIIEDGLDVVVVFREGEYNRSKRAIRMTPPEGGSLGSLVCQPPESERG